MLQSSGGWNPCQSEKAENTTLNPKHWKLLSLSYHQIWDVVHIYTGNDGVSYKNAYPSMLKKLENSETFIYTHFLSANGLNLFLESDKSLMRSPFVSSAGGALKFSHGHGLVIRDIDQCNRFTSLNRFAISAWIKVVSSAPAEFTIIDKSSIYGIEYRINFVDNLVENTRTLTIILNDNFGSTLSGQNALTWSIPIMSCTSVWWNLAVSYDGHTLKVIIDGNLISERGWSDLILNQESMLYVGISSTSPGNSKLKRKNDKYVVLLDSIAFWNSSLSPYWNHVYSPRTSDHSLVAYFNFNEGVGTTAVSQTGEEIIALLDPLHDFVMKISANDRWTSSDAPIDDVVHTVEDQHTLICLNASDPFHMTLSYSLTKLPSSGNLYFSQSDMVGLLSIQHDFYQHEILYLPAKGFVGEDSFSYKVTSSDGRSSDQMANILILVSPRPHHGNRWAPLCGWR